MTPSALDAVRGDSAAVEASRRSRGRLRYSWPCLFLALGLAGCGGTTQDGTAFGTPYRPGSATVIGDEGGGTEVSTAGCGEATCHAALEACKADGAADVIVDARGKVLEVICYGPDVTVVQVPEDQVPAYTTDGNNTVIVLDGVSDGADVVGDVAITGNNAVLYGQGPDTSVIGGTVRIEKNNAKVRGVRIQGDVTIDKNDTKLAFSVIEGNLTITGNNTTVAGCDVFGTVTITGNNTVLVSDRFGTAGAISGKNLTCSDDVRFVDADGDHAVSVAEIGAPLTCGS